MHTERSAERRVMRSALSSTEGNASWAATIRSLLGVVVVLASGAAHATSAYAGAFDGPAGSAGAENSDPLLATASFQSSTGGRGMYAKGTAAPGSLHALATASNNEGNFQFATTIVRFTDQFTLSHPAGVTEANLVWLLRADGSCAHTAGATNGRANATCYAEVSLNSGMLVLDGPGEITRNTVVAVDDALGNATTFLIDAYMQVGGYANNGSFLADFQNTARIFVHSTTPGVSLITDSGHNYSPIPEPSTASLLLGSLAVAGRWFRRTPKAS